MAYKIFINNNMTKKNEMKKKDLVIFGYDMIGDSNPGMLQKLNYGLVNIRIVISS
tara:strand:+ start:317 stop:481 length:165 start_codon:yes stop_codon:yes gene_type:complete